MWKKLMELLKIKGEIDVLLVVLKA